MVYRTSQVCSPLQKNNCHLTVERRALKAKAFETYSQIPQIMQITKESLKRCIDDVKMWKMMFMRLDYLRMNFLLERLSAERGGESRQNLVDVAREILDMIVFLWLERDRSGHRHYDYDYVVSEFITTLSSSRKKFEK
jgi:hypothetical protein